MKIEVTGCNNCPFRAYDSEFGLFCAYAENNDDCFKLPDIEITGSEYRTDLPHNCPITLNGGEITIKTKTE